MLVGRYAFRRHIGKGGFGSVDEYMDTLAGVPVAVKTIPAKFVNMESRRLMREVDIMTFLHSAQAHLIGFYSVFVTKSNANAITSNGISVPALTADCSMSSRSLDIHGPLYAGLSVYEKAVRYHEELSKMSMLVQKTDEFDLHIIMPLMEGDLFYFIGLIASLTKQRDLGLTPRYLAEVAVIYAFQMAYGLDYLHKGNIVHRDMKPDNVLVRVKRGNPYLCMAVIADMGLARDSRESETFYVCTRYYRPPEVITSVGRGSTSIDIWSLGCIFYEMCTGCTLFEMNSALTSAGTWDGGKASMQLEVILSIIGTPTQEDIERYMPPGNAKMYLLRSRERPSRLESLMREHWTLAMSKVEQDLWIDMVKWCISFFPETRPTAEQLCRHPIFTRFRMYYGENVCQSPIRHYTPTYPDGTGANTLRVENKAAILSLVRRALATCAPTPSNYVPQEVDDSEPTTEEGDDDDDDDLDDSGEGSQNGKSDHRNGNEEEDDDEEEEEEAGGTPRTLQRSMHSGDPTFSCVNLLLTDRTEQGQQQHDNQRRLDIDITSSTRMMREDEDDGASAKTRDTYSLPPPSTSTSTYEVAYTSTNRNGGMAGAGPGLGSTINLACLVNGVAGSPTGSAAEGGAGGGGPILVETPVGTPVQAGIGTFSSSDDDDDDDYYDNEEESSKFAASHGANRGNNASDSRSDNDGDGGRKRRRFLGSSAYTNAAPTSMFYPPRNESEKVSGSGAGIDIQGHVGGGNITASAPPQSFGIGAVVGSTVEVDHQRGSYDYEYDMGPDQHVPGISPLPSMHHIAQLPPVDEELRARYERYTGSAEEASEAAMLILDELTQNTYNTHLSDQLRQLLNFFMSLQGEYA